MSFLCSDYITHTYWQKIMTYTIQIVCLYTDIFHETWIWQTFLINPFISKYICYHFLKSTSRELLLSYQKCVYLFRKICVHFYNRNKTEFRILNSVRQHKAVLLLQNVINIFDCRVSWQFIHFSWLLVNICSVSKRASRRDAVSRKQYF